jgi:hypothetical protein
MDTAVVFESDLFRPFLPEEAQVNPGRHGAELAFWLSRRLAEHGVPTSYPDFEDWGWFLSYTTSDGNEYWLCCGNEDGAVDRWRCWLEPKARGLFGRNKAPVEEAAPLMRALREVLAREPEVRNIVWAQELA